MKKYKYIIPAGTGIWLRTDAIAHPHSRNGVYVEFITEQKMVFNESDLLVRGNLKRSNIAFFVFRLPKNNRGYNGFEVWEDSVTVVK